MYLYMYIVYVNYVWVNCPPRLGIWLGCNQDVAPISLTIHTQQLARAGPIYFTAQLYGKIHAWILSPENWGSGFVASQLSPHIYNNIIVSAYRCIYTDVLKHVYTC